MSENEKQLFENLAIEVMDNLYSKAVRLAGSAEGAEILVQQTYAAAFGVFEKFEKDSDYNNWFNEILIRTLIFSCLFDQEYDDSLPGTENRRGAGDRVRCVACQSFPGEDRREA